MALVRRAWIVAVAALGCGGPSHFGCDEDAQCMNGGVAGACEQSGYCSFPDETCDSGRRYGALAGGGLADLCVLDEDGSSTSSTTSPPSTMSTAEPPGSTGDTLAVGSEDSSSGPPRASTDAGTSSDGGETSSDGGSSSESSTGEPPLPSEGLVLWYAFEDLDAGQGTADLSGNGHDATCGLMGCPQGAAGVVGDAAAFDGIAQVLQLADDPILHFQAAYSVSVWARLDDVPVDYALVFGKSYGTTGANSYEIFYSTSTDTLRFNQDSTMPTGNVAFVDPPLATWMHVVGVFDGAVLSLYVDGAEIGTDPTSPVPLYDDNPMTVGADFTGPALDNPWPGAIDELRLYDRALEPFEIQQLYAQGA